MKALREFQGETTDYSVHGLPKGVIQMEVDPLKDAANDNPLTPMHASRLGRLRVEVAVKAQRLRPAQLMARIEQERRGNLPGGASESHVRKSRTQSAPSLDQHDRSLKRWEKDYEKGLRKALAALELCVGIEAEVLIPVRRATKRESLQAIGEISATAVACETCHGDVEPEDLRGGPRDVQECEACDRYRRRHNGEPRPEHLWGVF